MNFSEILLLARRLQLRGLRRATASRVGEHRGRYRGMGMEFDGHRAYTPFDDVRHIDWNVTARSRTPHIKEFREERDQKFLLMVDVSGSQNFGDQHHNKRGLALRLAAALMLAAAWQHDDVGLLLFADRVLWSQKPKKGLPQAWRLLEKLQQMPATPPNTPTNCNAALEQVVYLCKRPTHIFLISDFHCSLSNVRLRQVARKHALIGMGIAHPLEKQALPRAGFVSLLDIETQTPWFVDTNTHAAQQALATAAQQQQHTITEQLRGLRIPALWFDVHEPLWPKLFACFGSKAATSVR